MAMAGIAVALCSGAGNAQVPATGTLIPGNSTSAPVGSIGGRPIPNGPMEAQPSDAAFAAARAMAGCLVRRRPDDVQAMLGASSVGEFMSARAQAGGTFTRCALATASKDVSVIQMSFTPTNLFGLLAEAWLIRKGHPSLPVVPNSTGATSLDWMASDMGRRVVVRLADCLARREPDRSSALVRSEPLSSSEAAALASVTPLIPSCLEKNVTLATNRNGLRLALAAALYRRTVTEQGSAAPAIAESKIEE
jgi:hypothetical protein